MTTVWSNASFPPDVAVRLAAALHNHTLLIPPSLQSLNLIAAPPDPSLAHAEIAFGQPDPAQVIASANLKWVHLTSAGYTRYDREDLRAALRGRGGRLTNSSQIYNEPCAQHVLAMVMSLARQLPSALDDQRTARSWPAAPIREQSNLLIGQTVLVYGFGSIGRRLAELLKPFRMNLIGVRRRPAAGDPIRTISESEADAVLATADHVINILPASEATTGFFTAARFGRLKPTCVFYNIGRGTTVDQAALMAHLRSNPRAFAYLDVTDPEPLPSGHALWTLPNCLITPHTAGGHAMEFHRLLDHFLGNLARYESGVALVDQVI